LRAALIAIAAAASRDISTNWRTTGVKRAAVAAAEPYSARQLRAAYALLPATRPTCVGMARA